MEEEKDNGRTNHLLLIFSKKSVVYVDVNQLSRIPYTTLANALVASVSYIKTAGQCLVRCETILKIGLRALIVTIVWLVLLPYMTLWTWRLYFRTNENDIHGDNGGGNGDLFSGETSRSFSNHDPGSDSEVNELWQFLADCFEGQVITLMVIAVAVAMYIFKEWVAQNTPRDSEQELDQDLPIESRGSMEDNDNETTGQEHMHMHSDNNNGDPGTVSSALARQQVAVDALIKALDGLDGSDTATTATDGKNDIRRQLKDLQQDLQHEMDKQHLDQHDRHSHSQSDELDSSNQLPPLLERYPYPPSSQQDCSDTHDIEVQRLNSGPYQLGNDEEDELQVENMMSSIMIQDPKNAFKRHSWDDLQNSSKVQQQRLPLSASLYSKRDSLEFTPPSPTLLTTSKIEKSKSTILRQCGSTSAISGHQLFDETRSANHPLQLSGSTNSTSSLDCSSVLDDNGIHGDSNLAHVEAYHHHRRSTSNPHRYKTDRSTQQDQMYDAHCTTNGHTNNQPWTEVNNHLDDDDNSDGDGLDDDDEGIFHLGSDIDGVLEAIGMRGSPWVLLQNSILVFFALSLCLGVAVWLPYTLGRMIILVRPISFTGRTIATLRTLTDPAVDYILDHCFADGVSVAVTSLLAMALPPAGGGVKNTTDLIQEHGKTLSHRDSLYHLLGDGLLEGALKRWHQLAVGKSALDRGLCTLFGYFVLLAVSSLYKNSLPCMNDRARRATNNLIRQQCLFFKVISFVLLERLVLPVIYGILVDVATWSLAGDVASARWAFAGSYPFFCCFLYLFVGKCLMANYAALLRLCSETVRPGAMLFICRLPRLHSVQEIMEHSPSLLLWELCAGTWVYMTVIGFNVGTVAWVTSQVTDQHPLQWILDVPLSTLAIDILAAQFLLPLLAAYIKPRESFKQAMVFWWQTVSHQLRLSSFMFGGRYPEEEGVFIRPTLKSWVLRETCPLATMETPFLSNGGGTSAVSFKQEGQLVRMPKRDNFETGARQTMIVPVDPVTLSPLDPVERRIDHSSMATNEDATVVVYLPPHFETRMDLFLTLMWFSGSAMTCSLTVAPVLLGRAIFDAYLAPGHQIHDLYVLAMGSCAIVLTALLAMGVTRGTSAILKRQDYGGHTSLLRCFWIYVRQKALSGFKVMYMILAAGLLVPLLVGIAVDLYVFTPIQCIKSHPQELVLHLSKDWSFGVIYLGIMHSVLSIFPTNSLQRTMDQYTLNGLESLDVWTLTRTTLGPLILVIMGVITVPGGLAWVMMQLIGVHNASMKAMVFSSAYPIMLCMAVVLGAVTLVMKLIHLWLRTVKDDAYLVGRQLHNLDGQSLSNSLADDYKN